MADRPSTEHEPGAREPSEEKWTACDQCKKRKIKCNGLKTCRRCRNLQLACSYTRPGIITSILQSSEFKTIAADLASLQKQVTVLEQWKEGHQSHGILLNPEPSSVTDLGVPWPQYDDPQPADDIWVLPSILSEGAGSRAGAYARWPTTSNHDLAVARATLRRMGIDRSNEEDNLWVSSLTMPSPMNTKSLDTMSIEEARHFSCIYEDCCDYLYPAVDMAWLHHLLDTRAYTKDLSTPEPSSSATQLDSAVAKMVIGIGSALDGQLAFAAEVCLRVKPFLESQVWKKPSLEILPLLILMGTYQHIADDEHSAWRTIGSAAHICLELGLHQSASLYANYRTSKTIYEAVRLFWIVHSLDRRWSIGTGLPWTIDDSNVDPLLPEPANSDAFLKHIVQCNKIMSRICNIDWAYKLQTSNTISVVNELELEVQCWYDELPSYLKLNSLDIEDFVDRRTYKRNLMFDLRFKLARLHILRPLLRSASSIQSHVNLARRAVSVVKSIISQLRVANLIANVYQDQQGLYNYFLEHSLAVILLAVAHAPADFLVDTQEAVLDALDLLQHLKMTSPSSPRLWSIVQELKGFRRSIRAIGGTSLAIPSNVPIASMAQDGSTLVEPEFLVT